MQKKFNFLGFKMLLVKNGLNISKFAELAKIPQTTVYSWRKYENVRNAQNREAIERILGVKYEDLCIDTNDKRPDIKTDVERYEPQENKNGGYEDHSHQWPLIGSTRGGKWLACETNTDYAGYAERWEGLPLSCPDPNGFALRVIGDSMIPRFPPGCIIFVSPNTHVNNGSIAVVILEGRSGERESCLKQVYFEENGNLRLHSLNDTAYPDKIVEKEYVVKLLKVVGFRLITEGIVE